MGPRAGIRPIAESQYVYLMDSKGERANWAYTSLCGIVGPI